MPRETEVKFEVDELESFRRKLRKYGARCLSAGREENRLFDTTTTALKKRGESLRIKRIPGGPALLTFKGPQEQNARLKIREEIQTTLGSLEAGNAILRRIGLRENFRYAKKREHWELGKSSVELDTLEGHRFIEVEGTKRGIAEIANVLGLDWKRSTTESYPDLLKRLRKS